MRYLQECIFTVTPLYNCITTVNILCATVLEIHLIILESDTDISVNRDRYISLQYIYFIFFQAHHRYNIPNLFLEYMTIIPIIS